MRRFINILLISIVITLLGLGFLELYKFQKIDMQNDTLRHDVIEVPDIPEDEGNNINPEDPANRRVDFEKLQAINPDIKGWIYIPGTNIDYPILIGDQDEEYLSKDFNGNYLYAGSIFAFSGTDLQNDMHVRLYGHNMISKQMFGDLTNFRSQSYADQHNKMYIYLPGRTKIFTIISAFGCRYNDVIFTQLYTDHGTLENELIDRSVIHETPPSGEGQIYTLATCQGYVGTPIRFAVSFMLEKEIFVIEL